jgi:type II secretion system protein C
MRMWMAGLAGVWGIALALSAQMLRATDASVETSRKTAAIRRAAEVPAGQRPPPRPAHSGTPEMAALAPRPTASAGVRAGDGAEPQPTVPLAALRLVGTSVQDDARASLAVVEERQSGVVTTSGTGEAIFGWQLTEIARDHVIVSAQGQLHRLDLEGTVPPTVTEAAPAPAESWQALAHRVFHAAPLAPETRALVKSAITVTGDQERRVDRRKVWDAVSDNPFRVMREVAMAPAFDGFRLIGVKLTHVPDDGILRQSGFQSGDIIQTVNGEPMTDPARALKLPTLLQQSASVNVQVLRDGRATTLTYRLQ